MNKRLCLSLLVSALLVASQPALAQGMIEVPFGEPLKDLASDPSRIWSDDELAESQIYTRQWIEQAEVDVPSGRLIVSILFGDLCSLSQCPARVVLVTDDGALTSLLPAEPGAFVYELVCQTLDQFYLTEDGSALNTCGVEYPLPLPS